MRATALAFSASTARSFRRASSSLAAASTTSTSASAAATAGLSSSWSPYVSSPFGSVPELHPDNKGIDFDGGWVNSVQVNKSACLKRAGEIGARRAIKKQWQAAWLLHAIRCIDLTTLAGDDTPGNVARLCAKARNPVQRDLLDKLGLDADEKLQCAAVCVYPRRVKDAVAAVEGTGINVAAVATGFPSGQIRTEHKLAEIREAVADGAKEIDIVISRSHAMMGQWKEVYDEIRLFREACDTMPGVHMKSIISTGELATMRNVYQASLVSMMAGADFIKTSTGKEKTNATLPVSLTMVRALRDYNARTGYMVGFKPAGGISQAKQALAYLSLMKEELGDAWLSPHLFRFGASSLLTDIERQLHHNATGEYANADYFPMG